MGRVNPNYKSPTKRKTAAEARKYKGGTTLEQDAERLAQGIKNEAKKRGVKTTYNKPPASPSRKLKDVLGGLPLKPEVPKDVNNDAILNYLGATKPGSKKAPGTFFSDNPHPLPGGAIAGVGSDITKTRRNYVVTPVKLKGDIPGEARHINMALHREQFKLVPGKGMTYTGRPGEIIPTASGELRRIKPSAPLKTSKPAPKGSVTGYRTPGTLTASEQTGEVTSVDPITEQQNAERAARDAEREKNFVPSPDLPKGVTAGNQDAPTPTPYERPKPSTSPNTYDKSNAVQPYGSPKYTGEVTEENTETGRMTAEQVSGVAERMTKGLRAKGRTNVVTGTMTKVGRGKAATLYPTYTTSYVPKTAEELASIPSTAPTTEAGKAAVAAAPSREQLEASKLAAQGRAQENAIKRARNIATARAQREAQKD
jgi:hypothetical protein